MANDRRLRGETCAACSRAVHAQTRTVANLDGRTHTYCCLACAISEHHQTHQPVEVLAISEFESGQSPQPQQAFLVRGSRINHCLDMEPAPRVEDVGHPAHKDFDRCAPGMIAFGTADAAVHFAAKNGGAVLTFNDLARQAGLLAAHLVPTNSPPSDPGRAAPIRQTACGTRWRSFRRS